MGEETRQKDVKSTFNYISHIFHAEVLLNVAQNPPVPMSSVKKI